MEDAHSVWDWPEVHFPRKAMSLNVAIVRDIRASVIKTLPFGSRTAVIAPANPLPAFISRPFSDMLPKADIEWWTRIATHAASDRAPRCRAVFSWVHSSISAPSVPHTYAR